MGLPIPAFTTDIQDELGTSGAADGYPIVRTYSGISSGRPFIVQDSYTYDVDGAAGQPSAVDRQIVAVATRFTVTGSATAAVGVASGTITVTPNSIWAVGEVITPRCDGVPGVFTPTSYTISDVSSDAKTFTFTPLATGIGVITATTNTGAVASSTVTFLATPGSVMTFNVTGASSGALNVAQTITFTPTTGNWVTTVLTLTNTGLTGTWSVPTLTPTPGGNTPVTATFTPTVASTGTLSATATNGVAVNTPLTFTAAAATFLLDQYPSVEFGYSPRQLKSTATKAYTVSVGSNSSRYDVGYDDCGAYGFCVTPESPCTIVGGTTPIGGFTSGGTLTQLATAAGAAIRIYSEFCYGALGATGDRGQGTFSAQPYLWNGSNFFPLGTLPGGKVVLSPFYNGASETNYLGTGNLSASSFQAANGQSAVCAVTKIDSAPSAFNGAMLQWPLGPGSSIWALYERLNVGQSNVSLFRSGDTFAQLLGPTDTSTGIRLREGYQGATNGVQVIKKDGVQEATQTVSSPATHYLTGSAAPMVIGANDDLSVNFHGKIAEQIFGASLDPTTRAAVYANQLAFYGELT